MSTTSFPLLQTINDPADLRRLARAEENVKAQENYKEAVEQLHKEHQETVSKLSDQQELKDEKYVHKNRLFDAKMNLLPMQPGDVLETSADTSALEAAIGFKPGTELAIGLAEFVKWYRNYYL